MSATTQERQLQPRYRRILGFGDVLDESIQLYRQHWLAFAVVSACALIPPALIAVTFLAGGAFDTKQLTADIVAGRAPSAQSLAPLISAGLGVGLLSLMFLVAWSIAIVVVADAFLKGEEAEPTAILGRTLRLMIPVLLTGILLVIALGVLAALSAAAFIVPPVGLAAFVIALIGLIVWSVAPALRVTWLKWLIILTTPFGLVIYFAGLWSMTLVANVLEGRWLFGAMLRSGQLVDRHWFRVVAVLLVSGVIVGVLQYVPRLLIELPLSISAGMRGATDLGAPELVISVAASLVAQILTASLGSIVYTLLFSDLRNRREGTDIAERLSQLETVEPMPSA